MIIHSLADLAVPAEMAQEVLLDRGICFLCLEPLGLPVLWWRGTFDLLLHAECADRLALKLLCDRGGPAR